jgi:DNA-binding transcriptional LysR family regulator
MPPHHPWARRNAVHFVDTLDQVTVGVSPTGLLDQLLRRQAALSGRSLAHRLQVSSLDAACRLVAAGLGIAVLPREAAAPHAGAGRLALVPLADQWARRQFVVASRPLKSLSESARVLREHLGQLG